MNILNKIFDVFSTMFRGLAKIVTRERIDQALDMARDVREFVALAMPYARMLAEATPTQADDRILRAAESMGRSLEAVLAEPDPDIRRGLLQGIVRRALVERLHEMLAEQGQIKIGRFTLRIPDDIGLIPGDFLDSAVQTAYTFFVKNR